MDLSYKIKNEDRRSYPLNNWTMENGTIVAIYQPECTKTEFLKLPVIKVLDHTLSYDACVLTALNDTDEMYKSILEQVGEKKILVPSMLDFVLSKKN